MKKITVAICVIGLMLVFLGVPINAIISEYTSDNSIPLKLNDCPINITVHEAWDLLNNTGNGIQIPIDVRSENEWNVGFIDTPWPEYPRWYSIKLLETEDGLQAFMDMYTGEEVILYCRLGVRSLRGSLILCDASFNGTVYNMLGGITAWKAEGYPIRNNTEPNAPEINGPSGGVTGEELTYNFSTQDAEGDNVSYWVDWNDTTTPEWTGPFAHDEEITLTHTWGENGTYLIKAKVKDIFNEESDWEVFEVTIIENHPPNSPSYPSPSDGAEDVDIEANLSWNCSDPDNDDLTYDVYFEDNDPTPDELVSNNQTGTTFDPGTMKYETQYYWQIVAWDEYGASTSGPIWDFTTGIEPNDPPDEPSDPDPEDGEVDVSIETFLSWFCVDPNEDTLLYDVFFEADDETPDVLVSDDQPSTTFDPDILDYSTVYYWQIVAKDEHSATTIGPVWSFTTIGNNPPSAPTVSGPTSGKPGQSLTFTFNSVDPEGHDVRFLIDWGDGENETTSFTSSGTNKTASHSWSEKGTYTLTVKAEDEYGAKSFETSNDITIPRDKSINRPILNFLQNYFQSHPYLFPLLQKLIQQQRFGL